MRRSRSAFARHVRFVGENLPVFYVGVNYDPKSRTADDVKCEQTG